MAMDEPQKWEVWRARFNFEEGKGYKYRPVVIVGKQLDQMEAMMVTGCGNKLSLPHDHVLIDWEEAGLDKPSIARADRIARLPLSYIGTSGRIGKLSESDKSAISSQLKAKAAEALGQEQEQKPEQEDPDTED